MKKSTAPARFVASVPTLRKSFGKLSALASWAAINLDFACEAEKLGIELDGGQHSAPENRAYDTARTAALEQSGWRVLRFWNNEVRENIDGVVLTIHHALTRNHEG